MPLGGENIGRAYIRILADGEGLDESIRQQFEDEDGSFREGARRNSDAYWDEWTTQTEKQTTRKQLQDAISRTLAKGDFVKQFRSSDSWRRAKQGLSAEFGEAGRLAARNLEQELTRGLDVSAIQGRLADMRRDLARAQEQLLREQQKMTREHAAALLENERRDAAARLKLFQDTIDNQEMDYRLHIDRLVREDNRLQEERERIQRLGRMQEAAIAEDRRRELARMMEQQALVRLHAQAQAEDERRLRDQIRFLTVETRQMSRADELAAFSKEELRKKVDDLNMSYGRALDANSQAREALRDLRIEVDRANPSLARLERDVGGFADGLGRAFGRGSRNDFLNFIGSMVRNFARLPVGIAKVTTSLSDMYRKFGAVGGTARLLSGAVAGIAGAFIGLGPLISMLTMAGGAIVALGSTAVMAGIGSIGALGGVGLTAAAGIATLTLAFQNATPEARRAGREIRQATKDLGEVAAQEVFSNVTEQGRRFSQVLTSMRPIIRGVGQSISDVGDYWLALMQNKAFRSFRSTMEEFLPNAVESLGISLGNVLSGLGGVFQGIAPITQRFLNWVEDITDEFRQWATSKRGIADIKDFMEDAGDSASRLGRLVGSVIDFFAELVDLGNEAGDSLTGSLTDTIDNWTRALQDNPRAVRAWFNDARDFARVVGRLVGNLGELAGALDTTFSRNVATGGIAAISGALGALNGVLRTAGRLLGVGGDNMTSFVGQLAGAALVFRTFGGRLGGLTSGLSKVSRLARGAAGIGGLAAFAASAQTSDRDTQSLLDTLGLAATGFAVGGPWGAAVGGAIGLMKGFSEANDAVSSSMGEIMAQANAMSEELQGQLKASLDQTTGAITAQTRSLVSNELQQSKSFRWADKLGISHRDLVNSVLDVGNAQKSVRTQIDQASASIERQWAAGKLSRGEYIRLHSAVENLGIDLPWLTKKVNNARDSVDEAGEAAQTWRQALKGVPKEARTKIIQAGGEVAIKGIARLARQYDLTPKQIRTIIDATNVDTTLGRIRALNTDYKRLPKKVETRLDALNWDVTAGQIAGLREQYDLTPKQVSTIVRASGLAKTDKDVAGLVKKILELDRKDANPKVGANDKSFISTIQGVIKRLGDTDKKKADPKIGADTKGFDSKKRGVDGDIRELDGKKPEPKVLLDKSPFDGVLRGILGDITNLGGKKPTPRADLDPSPFNSQLSGVASRLANFDRSSATADARVNVVGQSALDTLASRLDGLMDKTVTVTANYVATGSGKFPKTAEGGLFSGAQPRLIGEAGPEAVVPLSRPLNQVDPAVRMLSAFAQGKLEGMAGGGVVGSGKTFNNEFNIYTYNTDPSAVAAETVNRLVATGY